MTTQPYTLFISDLHLEPARIGLTMQFIQFMRAQTGQAEAIYVLGDLFNAFIGQDDDSAFLAQVKAEFLSYTQADGKLYLMIGNRDFLMQEKFAASVGAIYLADPTLIDCYGLSLFLMHGDSLCTDDTAHQKWRRFYTSSWINPLAHAIPLTMRQIMARRMRRYSTARKKTQAASIMDVNSAAVAKSLQDSKADYLIHGHTHLPADHHQRFVLGEWPDKGAILKLAADQTFSRLTP